MGLSARLRTYGAFGELEPDALTMNWDAPAAFNRARTKGHLASVGQLGEYGGISLGFRLVWPKEWNAMSAWENGADPFNTYFRAAPEAFKSGAGLVHTDSTEDEPSAYGLTLLPEARIPANGALAFKLFLYRQSVFLATWGGWLILIRNGEAEIARVSEDYTYAKQVELLELLEVEEPTTAQQEAIDELAEEIYSDRHALDTPGGSEGWYNTDLEFVAIPEPAGRLHLRVNGTWEIIEHSDILNSGKYGVLWPDSTLWLRSQGGAYFWQVGYPSAAPLGVLRLGRYNTGRWSEYNFWGDAASVVANENGGSVTVSNTIFEPELVPGGVAQRGEVSVSLEPDSTRRKFPFLYYVGLSIEAGARNGGFVTGTPTWDSNDHNSPIKDVSPAIEGSHRPTQMTVTLRYITANTFAGAGANNNHLEHQIAHLSIAGQSAISNAIAMESAASDAAAPDENRTSTDVIVTLADAWARLDEEVMEDAPLGDGKRLGDYIRTILINGGYSGAYIAGVGASAGRFLPEAIGGELPLFLPRSGITRGDYLRSLVEEWGLGWELYVNNEGVWTFAAPNTTPLYNFTNDGTPGAYRILRELELPREVGEYVNWFRVHSTDHRGNAIVEEFPLWKSIRTATSKTYIGRKKLEEREVPAARTTDDLLYVRRSIYEQFKGTPRFHAFDTSYINGARPGQYATHKGVLCRIRSIAGGSIAGDKMGLVIQEMV